MKRRNFCKSLIGAAAAVALPASAMRDVLIHRGNPMTHDSTDFKVLFNSRGRMPLYYYQREALQQMNMYQHASRVAFSAHRQQGKTNFLRLGSVYHAELEKRVLAALNKKDQELLKTLSNFEAAESWREILPKQKRT